MPSIVWTSLILFAFFAHIGNCTLHELQLNVEVEHLSAAVTRTIRHFYSKRVSALSLIHLSMHPFAYYKQSEIINHVLTNTKSKIGYVIEESNSIKFTPFLRFSAIFFFDGYDAFRYNLTIYIYVLLCVAIKLIIKCELISTCRQFYKEISIKSFHYGGYFTIILTEPVQLTKITQILIDCWKFRMVNVNVLQYDVIEKRVIAYTYYPYTEHHCEQIQSTFLSYMNNQSFSIRTAFFPNKLKNLNGCPLFLATYTIPPYMIVHKLSNDTYITKGIEGNLYHELASTLNFRPMVRTGTENYVDAAAEKFQMLRKMEVNLTMFATVNTVERSKEFTASFPYAYASVVFTIPHGPPYTPLEKLVLPFKPLVWLCVSIVTGVALILIIYLSRCSKKWQDFVFGEKNRTPFLNYINITLGGVITHEPVRNFARFILMIWMLSSLVLRGSYTGALFSFIQSQRSAIEIDSLEKLIEYNFSIYSSKQMLRLLEIGSPHLSNK